MSSRPDHRPIPSPTRTRDLYLASAFLPAVPAAASIVVALEPGSWTSLSESLVRGATPEALLYSAACVVVAAPLAGVVVASHRRGTRVGWRDAARLGVAALVFCAVSALLTVSRLGISGETLRFVATSHAVLASVTIALGAMGALCGSLFRDALDAAACSLLLSATAAYGVLVAGASVAEIPPAVLRMALMASPVMSFASAAQLDIVHTDIWYQISPLAHIQVEYPTWIAACGTYLLAGCAGLLGTAWLSGRRAGS
jgi:hypothetical protein